MSGFDEGEKPSRYHALVLRLGSDWSWFRASWISAKMSVRVMRDLVKFSRCVAGRSGGYCDCRRLDQLLSEGHCW